MIVAFETLASTRVPLGQREESPIGPLVHPVHKGGAVFAWGGYCLAVVMLLRGCETGARLSLMPAHSCRTRRADGAPRPRSAWAEY
jgi:hypothetical protein